MWKKKINYSYGSCKLKKKILNHVNFFICDKGEIMNNWFTFNLTDGVSLVKYIGIELKQY